MQDAIVRDKVTIGIYEDNVKKIKSVSVTVRPSRKLQKIDFRGLLSNPRPPPCNSRDVTSTCDITPI